MGESSPSQQFDCVACSVLKDYIEMLKGTLATTQHQLDVAQQQLTSALGRLAATQRHPIAAQSSQDVRMAELQKQLADCGQENADLQSRLAVAQEQCRVVEDRLEAALAHQKVLKDRLEAAQQQLNLSRNRESTLEEQLLSVQQQLAASRQANSVLENHLAAVRGQLPVLEERPKTALPDQEVLQSRLAAAERELEEARARESAFQEQLLRVQIGVIESRQAINVVRSSPSAGIDPAPVREKATNLVRSSPSAEIPPAVSDLPPKANAEDIEACLQLGLHLAEEGDMARARPHLDRSGLGPLIPWGTRIQRLFRADGRVEAAKFHSACDGKAPTFFVVKTKRNSIFGGFTTLPWAGPIGGEWQTDAKAFGFILRSPKVSQAKQFWTDAAHGVLHGASSGPHVGGIFVSYYSSSNNRTDYVSGFQNLTDKSLFDGAADGKFEPAVVEVWQIL